MDGALTSRLRTVVALAAVSVAALTAAAPAAAEAPLTHHGGPVLHENRVHAVFLEPPGRPFPTGYKAAVAKYFRDVAADAGRRTNVYSTVRQYRDAAGPASDRIAFAGSHTSTAALPASGCADGLNDVCLTDAQLTAALRSVVAAGSLPRGLGAQYFVFTPPGVGSCYDGTSETCANVHFCSYHSWDGTGGDALVYASHPFVDAYEGCTMGDSPTGTGADGVLNVVSHEHVEMIVNPTGAGWFDAGGVEGGDRCAWQFGATRGSAGALYNQTIAGTPYLLQLEWSNQDGGCVASTPNRPPTAAADAPASGVAGTEVTFGATAADSDGTIASYSWDFGDGGAGSGAHPAHAYARAGDYDVRLTVADDEGATATRTLRVSIAVPPVEEPPVEEPPVDPPVEEPPVDPPVEEPPVDPPPVVDPPADPPPVVDPPPVKPPVVKPPVVVKPPAVEPPATPPRHEPTKPKPRRKCTKHRKRDGHGKNGKARKGKNGRKGKGKRGTCRKAPPRRHGIAGGR